MPYLSWRLQRQLVFFPLQISKIPRVKWNPTAMEIESSFQTLFHFYFLCLLFTPFTAAQNPSSSSSIISRFQQYLQINTAQPNPKYYEATDFILSQAKDLSLQSQTIEFVKNKPLILLKWPGKDPNLPSVLLNSHTDVVPVEAHKWNHPPFGAHIDSQGNIYARGSQATISTFFPLFLGFFWGCRII